MSEMHFASPTSFAILRWLNGTPEVTIVDRWKLNFFPKHFTFWKASTRSRSSPLFPFHLSLESAECTEYEDILLSTTDHTSAYSLYDVH